MSDASYPSTVLRMVPLPTGFAGREERKRNGRAGDCAAFDLIL